MMVENMLEKLEKRIAILEDQNKVLEQTLQDSFLAERNLKLAKKDLSLQFRRSESVYHFMMDSNQAQSSDEVILNFMKLFQKQFLTQIAFTFKYDIQGQFLKCHVITNEDGNPLPLKTTAETGIPFKNLKLMKDLTVLGHNEESSHELITEILRGIDDQSHSFIQKGLESSSPKVIYNLSMDNIRENLIFVFVGINPAKLSAHDPRISMDSEAYFRLLGKTFSQIYEIKVLFSNLLDLTRHLEAKVQKSNQELVQKKTSLTSAIQELKKTQNLLMQNEKLAALGEMAQGVAHEINNPLAIIDTLSLTMVRILNKSENPDEKKEALLEIAEDLKSTTKRMSVIIKALTIFARDGKGDDYKIENLFEVIEETLPLVSDKYKSAGVRLVYGSEVQGTPCLVPIRRTQISQVLLNLLQNAHDAIEESDNPWVKIHVESDKHSATIFVTDSGPGIDNEIVNKMFQPFYTTKEIGKGTGLGLSVAKGIINQHGGELGVNPNSPNTQFYIKLKL